MGVAFRTGAVRIRSSPREPALRRARICYDHLAGEMGVVRSRACCAPRALATQGGRDADDAAVASFCAVGIDADAVAAQRRASVRPCLDWSERRHHLAGALGAALLERMIALRLGARGAIRASCRSRRPANRRCASDSPERRAEDCDEPCGDHRLGRGLPPPCYQRRPRDVPRHRRRVDHVAHRHSRAAHLARARHRARHRRRGARTRLRRACAHEVELIVYGSCSHDEQVPNSASGVQLASAPRARRRWTSTPRARASSMACRRQRAMIRAGMVTQCAGDRRRSSISPFMDWEQPQRRRAVRRRLLRRWCCRRTDARRRASPRSSAATPRRAKSCACAAWAARTPIAASQYGRHAVGLRRPGDLQARRQRHERGRAEALAQVRAHCRGRRPRRAASGQPAHHRSRREDAPACRWSRVFLNVAAIRQHVGGHGAGRAGRGARRGPRRRRARLLLMPAFGGGLTWCAHVVRWGERVTPLDASDVALPPCTRSCARDRRRLSARSRPIAAVGGRAFRVALSRSPRLGRHGGSCAIASACRTLRRWKRATRVCADAAVTRGSPLSRG